MNKILSVSIASYNAEQYLERVTNILYLSEKLRRQIELIIVNDGSTDKTLKKAKKLKEKWPDSIVLIDKENGGYGSTINASIKVAKGKFFKVLDADDWFNEETIEDFLDVLEKTDEKMIISPYYIVTEGTRQKSLIDRHSAEEIYYVPVYMHEICINTDLYRNANFQINEHCFYTDTEYALECMILSTAMKKYDKPVYCYLVGREGQSVSKEAKVKHMDDSEIVVHRCMELLSSCDKNICNYDVIKQAVCNMVNVHYQTISYLNDGSCAFRMRQFDQYVKNANKHIYRMASKRIKLLRATYFISEILIKKILG